MYSKNIVVRKERDAKDTYEIRESVIQELFHNKLHVKADIILKL